MTGPSDEKNDPALVAVERHRRAIRALPDDEGAVPLELEAEQAFRAWLMAEPSTLTGVLASLEHASTRFAAYDNANLFESAGYLRDGTAPEVLAAGEGFPKMIAGALRKIIGTK